MARRQGVRLYLVFERTLLDAEFLCSVLDDFTERGFSVERVSDVEPIRSAYSHALVASLVAGATADAPCRALTARGAGMDFMSIRACMPMSGRPGSVNVLSLRTRSVRNDDAQAMRRVLETYIGSGAAGYGAVDLGAEFDAQHVTGTANERMAGVFWANGFGARYVQAIGRDRLDGAGWSSVAARGGTCVSLLYENFDEPPLDLLERRERARFALGPEKFLRGAWAGIPWLGH
jgi:hypothetical protein